MVDAAKRCNVMRVGEEKGQEKRDYTMSRHLAAAGQSSTTAIALRWHLALIRRGSFHFFQMFWL